MNPSLALQLPSRPLTFVRCRCHRSKIAGARDKDPCSTSPCSLIAWKWKGKSLLQLGVVLSEQSRRRREGRGFHRALLSSPLLSHLVPSPLLGLTPGSVLWLWLMLRLLPPYILLPPSHLFGVVFFSLLLQSNQALDSLSLTLRSFQTLQLPFATSSTRSLLSSLARVQSTRLCRSVQSTRRHQVGSFLSTPTTPAISCVKNRAPY